MIAAFREGARYVWHEPLAARRCMILIGVTTIFGFSFLAMLPVYARDVLGTDAARLRRAGVGGRRRRAVGRALPRGASGRGSGSGGSRSRRRARVRDDAGRDGARAELLGRVRACWRVVGCSMVLQSISANTIAAAGGARPPARPGDGLLLVRGARAGAVRLAAGRAGSREHFGVAGGVRLGGTACVVWLLVEADREAWRARSAVGERARARVRSYGYRCGRRRYA